MLKSLELENFRAFSKRVHIDFRPITILIGRNSAGKSSVLKWLQMVRQSLGTMPSGVFFNTHTPHADLGEWKELRNKSMSGKSHHYALEFGAHMSPLQLTAQLEQQLGQPTETAGDGRTVVREGSPVANYRVMGHVTYRRQQDFGTQTIVVSNEGGDVIFKENLRSLKGSSFLKPATRPGSELVNAITADLQFLSPARDFISTLMHLGAVRRESRSVIDMRTAPAGDVGHEAEHAIPHLVEIFHGTNARSKSQRDFILNHTASVLQVDGIRVRKIGDGLSSRPEGRNAATQVTHRLSEFGFGVSQAVPIFIQGALMEKGSCLTVEQPEAQLHPTAQLEMGSFFAELWTERGVGSVIETHSSNILLRLRKLVRAGTLTAEDVGVAYFHSENGFAEVTNMQVKADGELDGKLPMEFFGADVFEALEMNATKPAQENAQGHAE